MEQAIYNIPDHVSGDTWRGIYSLTISVNSVPPEASLSEVRIQFRKSYLGSVVLELASGTDAITILSAANWEIRINKQIISLPPDKYVYDIQTVDADGQIKTYVKGSWEILEDITR